MPDMHLFYEAADTGCVGLYPIVCHVAAVPAHIAHDVLGSPLWREATKAEIKAYETAMKAARKD